MSSSNFDNEFDQDFDDEFDQAFDAHFDRLFQETIDKGGTYSSSSTTASRVQEEACPRPVGVKAAKRKGKKSEASCMLQLEKMCEIKEKNIALRERVSNQRLLDSLIAKTELSAAEVNLKNQLIAEMLGNK